MPARIAADWTPTVTYLNRTTPGVSCKLGVALADRRLFTKQYLASLKPRPERYFIYDTKTPGLQVCVTPSGKKTFYRYGRIEGRPVRLKLGTFPATSIPLARGRCWKATSDIEGGANPHRERKEKRQALTLGKLWDWYLLHHSRPHKRTSDRDEQRYTAHLSRWRTRALESILRADVQALHKSLHRERGYSVANHTVSLLRHMYVMAHDLGYRGDNPAAGIKRFKTPERDRFLRADEMPVFFAAINGLRSQDVRDALLLDLFTGARKSNVLAMHREQIDLAARTWTVPYTRSKNKEPMVIALSEPAIEIISRRLDSHRSPWLFPADSASGHRVELQHALETVRQRSGLKDLRVHDLRRTLGSWQAAAGTSLPIIGKSLGHRSQRSTAIYARLDLGPVRQSVSAAAEAMLKAASENNPKKG